jgi:LuxR family maltose regulon positive regulatory protein
VRELATCKLAPADLAVLRGLVLLGNGNPAGALAALGPAVNVTAPFRYPYASLCGWVLSALAADRLGDRPACDHALERALALAQPQGLRRAFADHGPEALALLRRRLSQLRSGQPFARGLLADGPAVPAGASAGLSDREAEVLAMLPSELSYHDVAEQLYVSVNTVKTHVKSIYRKLGVATRREAVERARGEGLL